MRGYYVISASLMNLRRFLGVQKKVHTQVEVFQTIAKTDLLSVDTVIAQEANVFYKIPRVLPWTRIFNWNSIVSKGPCDFLYVRKVTPLTRDFISFLKECKGQGTRSIILEIPTYPYDSEFRGIRKLYLFKDKLFRPYLKKYVDRVVTFSQDDEIFGIPTIKIVNGIDVDSERIRAYQPHGDAINLIGVASLSLWHGYDRIISGLAEYYANGGKKNIVFHIVGEGGVLKDYKKLVAGKHLEEHVVFHGAVYGEELDRLYDSMDIGVCSLGIHRGGEIRVGSFLKSREYLAKGLPMIISTPIDVITDEFPYALKVSEDESPVDMEEVARFFREKISHLAPDALSQSIRAYAKERCDMKVTMKPVLDYLTQNQNEEL